MDVGGQGSTGMGEARRTTLDVFGRGCDLIDVTIMVRTPVATPTVVSSNLFFGQGGDQLNGG